MLHNNVLQEQRLDRDSLEVQLCSTHGPVGEGGGGDRLPQLLPRLPLLQPGCFADRQKDQLQVKEKKRRSTSNVDI